MICNKCTKQIDDDSKFCVFCGHKIIVPENYIKGNLEPFCENEKWGYKDKNTRDIIISPMYSQAGQYFDKRAIVALNWKYSVLDQSGNPLTQFKYDFISDFENGYAKVKRDNRWTFMDINCNEITPFIYNKVESFIGEIAHVEIGGEYCIINKSGKQITENKYDFISDFKDSIAQVKQGDFFGLINDAGNEILPCKFDHIYEFKGELAQARIVGEYVLINKSGKQITEIGYDFIYDFEKSVAQVKKNNFFGLIDDTGKEILPCQYNYIHKFEDMLAQIVRSYKFGFVNFQGKIVVPCKYDELSIIAQNGIAARDGKTWTCFNRLGEDVSGSDMNFKNFMNGKKRKRRSKRIAWILLIVITIMALAVCDLYLGDAHTLRVSREIFYPEEVCWEEAVANTTSHNTSPAELYLHKYPKGKYADSARTLYLVYSRMQEKEVWKNSLESNTTHSFNSYLAKYPKGIYSEEARVQIAWTLARGKNTVEGLELFINQYPKSKEAVEALEIASVRKFQTVKNLLFEWGDAVTEWNPKRLIELTFSGSDFYIMSLEIAQWSEPWYKIYFEDIKKESIEPSITFFTAVFVKTDKASKEVSRWIFRGSAKYVDSKWKLNSFTVIDK